MSRRASNWANERASEQGSRQTLFAKKNILSGLIFVRIKDLSKTLQKTNVTDGMINMTASELINELILISEHADGNTSHVNWRFSYDTIHYV